MHFHGNSNTHIELQWAVRNRIRGLFLDKEEQIEGLDTICRAQSGTATVMMRRDPPVAVETHLSFHTSGAHPKFGFLWDCCELDGALNRLANIPERLGSSAAVMGA
jgi:diaminopimelate decarboxylase